VVLIISTLRRNYPEAYLDLRLTIVAICIKL